MSLNLGLLRSISFLLKTSDPKIAVGMGKGQLAPVVEFHNRVKMLNEKILIFDIENVEYMNFSDVGVWNNLRKIDNCCHAASVVMRRRHHPVFRALPEHQ